MKKQKKKLHYKKVSIACIVSLFISCIAYCSYSTEKNKVNLDNFNLPPALGAIMDKHKANNGKLLIQIKDMHSTPSVQRDIAGIIEFLNKELNINNIYVEGYWGNYDIDSVRNHPADKSLKNAVLEYFTEKGKISGTEYFCFNTNQKVSVFGIEDKKIYEDNRQSLRNVLTGNKLATNYLFDARSKLDSRLKSDLNPDLYGFFHEYQSFFWYKNTDFNSFAKILSRHIKSADISESQYKLTFSFLHLVDLENKIKTNILENEIKRFLTSLNGKVPTNELKPLTDKFLKYLVGKLNADEFFIFCGNFAGEHEINMNKYPQMRTKIEIANLQKKINSTGLFNELREVSYKIIKNLSESNEEIDLCNYSDYVCLLSRLVNLNLTHNECNWYLSYAQNGWWEKLTGFIQLNGKTIVSSEDISECIAESQKFYTLSRKRDNILCEKAISNMAENNVSAAIIVTGGFHTEEILKEL